MSSPSVPTRAFVPLRWRSSLAELDIESVKTSFAISSGVGVGTGTEGIEFVVGPSLGFVNDAVFFTFGFTIAQVEKLSGFENGDPVPEGLTDPLPIETTLDKGFMFVVTYKLR